MNVEKLVAYYLRNQGMRVVTRTPRNTDDGWIKVGQISANQDDAIPAYHLVHHYLQLDCYASVDNGQPEAAQTADQVARALAQIDQAEHDEAEVTACRIENGGFHNPDTGFSPDRERFIVDVTLSLHPHAVPAS